MRPNPQTDLHWWLLWMHAPKQKTLVRQAEKEKRLLKRAQMAKMSSCLSNGEIEHNNAVTHVRRCQDRTT